MARRMMKHTIHNGRALSYQFMRAPTFFLPRKLNFHEKWYAWGSLKCKKTFFGGPTSGEGFGMIAWAFLFHNQDLLVNNVKWRILGWELDHLAGRRRRGALASCSRWVQAPQKWWALALQKIRKCEIFVWGRLLALGYPFLLFRVQLVHGKRESAETHLPGGAVQCFV